MTNKPRTHLSTLALVAGLAAFSRPERDPMRIPEPDSGEGKNICGVTFNGVGRESVHSPEGGEGGGGAGGGAATFTQEQVDRIVQERVGKLKDQIKTLEASSAEGADLKKRLDAADAAAAERVEAEALKGKTDLEKLQHQLAKAEKVSKDAETAWMQKHAAETARATAAEGKFKDHVTHSSLSEALLSAGGIPAALKAGVRHFLAEAQLDYADDHSIRSITVGGKAFDKPAEAAAQFLKDNPYLAKPSEGGSGTQRNGVGGGQPVTPVGSHGFLSAGMQEHAARG